MTPKAQGHLLALTFQPHAAFSYTLWKVARAIMYIVGLNLSHHRELLAI
jgi:hypothetical protein